MVASLVAVAQAAAGNTSLSQDPNLPLFRGREFLYNCNVRKETKEKAITFSKQILLAIAILGLVPVAVLAGNAVQLLKYTPLGRKRYRPYEINRNVNRFLNGGILKKDSKDGQDYLALTDKGAKLIRKYQLQNLVEKRSRKWDRKFRVVIFDISEQRKKTRDYLRLILKSLGFICLQNSVWIFPYHCQDIVELLKSDLNLKKEIVYMTVDSIENDDWLIKKFKLPK